MTHTQMSKRLMIMSFITDTFPLFLIDVIISIYNLYCLEYHYIVAYLTLCLLKMYSVHLHLVRLTQRDMLMQSVNKIAMFTLVKYLFRCLKDLAHLLFLLFIVACKRSLLCEQCWRNPHSFVQKCINRFI